MKILFFLSFLMLSEFGYSQTHHKIYYYENWKEVTHRSEAAYYREVTYGKHGNLTGIVRTYYITGELEWEGKMFYFDPSNGNRYTADGLCTWYYKDGNKSMEITFVENQYDGLMTVWYRNGQKAQEVAYKMGNPNGKWITYHENGKLKSEAEFINGKQVDKWAIECDEFERCQKVYQEEFKSIESSSGEWPSMLVDVPEPNQYTYKMEFLPLKGMSIENISNKDVAQWIYLPLETNYNFSIETIVHLKGGDNNSGYGLIWGFKDWNNYYYFYITANGYFKSGAVSEGINREFTKWKYCSYINQNGSTNSLKVNKVQHKMYFSINRQVVEKGDFHDFRVNNIGFLVQAGRKKVVFERLLVKQDLYENQIDPINLVFQAHSDKKAEVFNQSNVNHPIDVEEAIPIGKPRGNAIGIVLGIENYKNTTKATFADRDAEYVKRYFINTLGIPSDRIYYKTDENVSKAEFQKIFGEGGWLDKRSDSTSEIFIYYVGHGAPAQDGKAFLMPFDCDPNYVHLSGYSLDEFYGDIGKLKAKQVVVFLDACFSGQDREKKMFLADARSLGIKPKDAVSADKVAILCAVSSDQSSIGWPEKTHGLFTYYLLKGLQGAADRNNDKKITMGELGRYVKEKVDKQAGFLDREQTPQLKSLNPDLIITETW